VCCKDAAHINSTALTDRVGVVRSVAECFNSIAGMTLNCSIECVHIMSAYDACNIISSRTAESEPGRHLHAVGYKHCLRLLATARGAVLHQ
jgi:hypothetical protein